MAEFAETGAAVIRSEKYYLERFEAAEAEYEAAYEALLNLYEIQKGICVIDVPMVESLVNLHEYGFRVEQNGKAITRPFVTAYSLNEAKLKLVRRMNDEGFHNVSIYRE